VLKLEKKKISRRKSQKEERKKNDIPQAYDREKVENYLKRKRVKSPDFSTHRKRRKKKEETPDFSADWGKERPASW